MKTLLCLTLICVATAQAQYKSAWFEFDAGASDSAGKSETIHRGVFTGWLRHPMKSSSYTLQQGNPSAPLTIVPDETAPALTITRSESYVRISWPVSAASFVLEARPDLNERSSWSVVPGRYQTDGAEWFVLVPPSQSSQFYRLAISR